MIMQFFIAYMVSTFCNPFIHLGCNISVGDWNTDNNNNNNDACVYESIYF